MIAQTLPFVKGFTDIAEFYSSNTFTGDSAGRSGCGLFESDSTEFDGIHVSRSFEQLRPVSVAAAFQDVGQTVEGCVVQHIFYDRGVNAVVKSGFPF